LNKKHQYGPNALNSIQCVPSWLHPVLMHKIHYTRYK